MGEDEKSEPWRRVPSVKPRLQIRILLITINWKTKIMTGKKYETG
jgi:hypothetical protein